MDRARFFLPIVVAALLASLACSEDLAGPSSGVTASVPLVSSETVPACGEEQFIEIFTDQGAFSPLDRIESVLTEDLQYQRDTHYIVQSTSQLISGIKSGVRVVILPSNIVGDSQLTADNVNSAAAQENLFRFVQDGGVLVMHIGDNLPADSYEPPMLKRLFTDAAFPPPLLLVDPSHPVVLGPDLVAGTTDDWTQASIQCQDPRRVGRCNANARLLPDLPPDASTVITASGEPVFAEYEIGLGKVILTSILVESGTYEDPKVIAGEGSPRRILSNELFYATSTAVAGDTVPPRISSFGAVPNPVPVGTVVRLEAVVEDAGCGDGGVQGVQFNQDGSSFVAMSSADGAFDERLENATAELSFDVAGVHELCVTVVDEAGNGSQPTCTLLAVYDPAAGFVTGAGIIDSPIGAYTVVPNVGGMAQFAFVSRYLRGASLPAGTTHFAFKAGDLDFRSSAYEWLVVSGARAQFKGTGTINGGGDFGFLLTALDGDLRDQGDDAFRIKIWDRSRQDAIVYDNRMGSSDTGEDATELTGGSIRIQPK